MSHLIRIVLVLVVVVTSTAHAADDFAQLSARLKSGDSLVVSRDDGTR